MNTKEGYWRLSPSGLYGYTECKSCFWVTNHFKRAPQIPMVLNDAMDKVLKSRYDKYRKQGTFPPEVIELKDKGLRLYKDSHQLNIWREDINSLKVVNEKKGYVLVGKIDELLVEANGKFVPTDYKSSGNAPSVDKQKYYIDQLNAYGFMFEMHGHEVSNRAYLLHYFVKNKSATSKRVEFDSHIDPVKLDVKKFESKLKKMVDLLNGPYPGHNEDCEKCKYYKGRHELTH